MRIKEKTLEKSKKEKNWERSSRKWGYIKKETMNGWMSIYYEGNTKWMRIY